MNNSNNEEDRLTIGESNRNKKYRRERRVTDTPHSARGHS